MAVSIKDLIAKKETLTQRKKQKYDIETSAGVLTVKMPTRSHVADLLRLDDSDAHLIIGYVVEPNLRDPQLLEAYGCLEPTDIVEKIFDPGEIPAIGRKIMELAGYGKNIRAELHDEVKN
jgi:hypothetical protein